MEQDRIQQPDNSEYWQVLAQIFGIPNATIVEIKNCWEMARASVFAIQMGIDETNTTKIEQEYFMRGTDTLPFRELSRICQQEGDIEGMYRAEMKVNRIIAGLGNDYSDDEVNEISFKRNVRAFASILGLDMQSTIEDVFIEATTRGVVLTDLELILNY